MRRQRRRASQLTILRRQLKALALIARQQEAGLEGALTRLGESEAEARRLLSGLAAMRERCQVASLDAATACHERDRLREANAGLRERLHEARAELAAIKSREVE